MKLFGAIIALSMLMGFSAQAQKSSASASAQARQFVVSAISLQKLSDLDFGSAAQGDRELVVPPGTTETQENASFLVSGEAGRVFAVQLPADNALVMRTQGGGSPQKEIRVRGFTSFPGGSGILDKNGRSNLFVGATRAALHPNQAVGLYEGDFVVTVVY